MQKTVTWQQDLIEFLGQVRREQKLDYAVYSCAQFASDAMKAQTGEDLHELLDFGGSYTSEEEAAQAIKRSGFNNLAQLVAEHLPVIQPSEAHFGDIAAVRGVLLSGELERIPEELKYGLGVCEPPFVWVLMTNGLGRVRLMDPVVVTCFRVGVN